ncbi:DNA-binding response regulator, NarL/FixJ family, contains REC and HTH domains [Saccharopolyspora shandongensis]|uniref:DNA-binding response regulator, NarL/FixJ family, contains REC and HTH domains n=1 Tax=Saccharopolyspora shandongensis TaxID=418495 RepID=A0A1H2ZQE5_9PSEU|nr:LuxR C-terminal-related transcriptional regulator [Saccharopolyspora shandongensis]SDX19074.1 DNA-binding response regulator, NarL/FixJ family, contains REC and HTH domains [Saccharopolyspora shandongensis]
MTRVPVAVYAGDPILEFGVAQQLRPRPEVEVLRPSEQARAEVSLVVIDRLDDAAGQLLRRLQRTSSVRTGLIVSEFEQDALQTTIECGVAAVLRRSEADQDRMVGLITALVRGEGMLPGDMLGRLLDHVGKLQRSATAAVRPILSTLNTREVEVLRLIADGFDTREIAVKMSYSERTVKNILQEVTTRLQLRNRAHAVGYVMRHGLI